MRNLQNRCCRLRRSFFLCCACDCLGMCQYSYLLSLCWGDTRCLLSLRSATIPRRAILRCSRCRRRAWGYFSKCRHSRQRHCHRNRCPYPPSRRSWWARHRFIHWWRYISLGREKHLLSMIPDRYLRIDTYKSPYLISTWWSCWSARCRCLHRGSLSPPHRSHLWVFAGTLIFWDCSFWSLSFYYCIAGFERSW